MAGKALATFADFVLATNEHQLTDPKDILNEAVRNSYTLSDCLRGRGVDEVVQSGTEITDRVQLRAGGGFGFYDPNEAFSPTIEELLTKLRCPWRFAKDYWAWTDHEVELNGGDRNTQWKNLRDSKQMGCRTSLYNGIEVAIWATPAASTMENFNTTTGGRPYGIRCFLTEDGLAPSGFTNVMGVNPATEPRWRNQVSSYNAASIDTTLIGAFEDQWRRVKFEAPETREKYFTETKFRKFKIYTNLDGWKTYLRIIRQGNDRNYPINDPGYATDDPVFGKIPIKAIDEVTNVGYTTGQPRYFWVNYEYLFPIFHSKRYMFETDPINGGAAGQPFSWVVYKDIWYNWFCRSRQRQGMVVPA